MVLRGVASGLTDVEIASSHHRAHATIRTHYANILAKLLPGVVGGNKRVLLTRIAIGAGYVSAPGFHQPTSE